MTAKFVTVPEMLAIERAADASGLTYAQMMENAGKGLAEVLLDVYRHIEQPRVLALVGRGNNGGDALVALANLVQHGWVGTAYIVGQRPTDDPLVQRIIEVGGEVLLAEDDTKYKQLGQLLKTQHIVIDGLLGTGITLPLRQPIPEVLNAARRALKRLETPPEIVAVDCPSGVDCQTGQAAPECLRADLTVCMAAVKVGLLRFPAYDFIGDLVVVDIGLPAKLKPWKAIKRWVADAQMVQEALPPRPLDAHKGTFGTAMLVAGSVNYTGAALLAGEAAYRIGAGLVTLAVPSLLHAALAGQFPEATWLLIPHETGAIAGDAANLVRRNLDRVSALLLGPGFGLEDCTLDFLEQFLKGRGRAGKARIGFVEVDEVASIKEERPLPPLVIDADGLKLLARIEGWAKKLPKLAILTPHPGEMAVLTGLSKEDIQANRLEIAEQYAREWGHVVVLKGAFTLVASPDGRTAVIPVASPALARAGTGDVLAGMITGLRAQGLHAFEAASLAAWIHAHTGLRAANSLGSTAAVLAGDLLLEIPSVIDF